MVELAPMDIPSSKERSLKGEKLVFSLLVFVETIKSIRPFTRSTTKQHVPMEDDASKSSSEKKDKSHPSNHPIEIIDINTPPREINPTFKRLRRQELKMTN
jgi:hypothetical protein